jgi:hypothetical protein
MHIGNLWNDRSPELGRREVTHVGAGWRDAECRFRAELGGDGNRGCDVAVVEDLVKARAQEFSEADARLAGIGSVEGSAGVESAGFVYGNGHVADLEPFELSSGRNLVNLWMIVDSTRAATAGVSTAVLRNVRRESPAATSCPAF